MADYIQYSTDVEYEDHAYGRVETRTETLNTFKCKNCKVLYNG